MAREQLKFLICTTVAVPNIYNFRVLSLTSLTIFETLEFSGIMNASLELAFLRPLCNFKGED